MQKTANSPYSLKNLRYLAVIVGLVLGLAADMPQGQAVQSPAPTGKLSETTSATGEKDKPRFTLNFKNVNLRDVLMLLTRNSSYSLILEPGIDTVLPLLDLKGVTLETALQSILPGLGLNL